MHLQDSTEPQNVLKGLSVALHHTAVAADQRSVCTLLQVSKAWKTAVQQSAASKTDIRYTRNVSAMNLSMITGFAGWIAKHPGLIGKLDVQLLRSASTETQEAAALLEAANKLVDFGLQVAAASASWMSSAPLRLISYTTSASLTEGSLAALPAATLTKLKLLKLTSSRWSLSLEKLSNLRAMHVCLRGVGTDAATSFLQGVGRLPQLTQLRIINPPPGSDMRVLPASLQHLQLSNRVDAETGAPLNAVFVDLQRLTCLTQLQLRSRRITPGPSVPIAEGSSVPANLLSLETVARWPEQGLVGLASLHQVTLIQLWGLQDSCRANHRISMCHLTQLKQLLLDLRYDEINEGPPHNGLLEVAAAWHKTPLSCLQIKAASSTATALQQLMQHVAAVTRLTKLVLTVRYVSALFAPAGLAICEQLTATRGHESLELSVDRPDMFAQQDAQHLSTLVALSGLHLKYADAGPRHRRNHNLLAGPQPYKATDPVHS